MWRSVQRAERSDVETEIGGRRRWRRVARSEGRPYIVSLRIYAAGLAAAGLAMLVGGAWLISLGGAVYYALAGMATLFAALQLWGRNGLGSTVYGLMLVGTLAWSLWESGADAWALAPRLIGPAVLGLVLLGPMTRSLRPTRAGVKIGGYAALAVLVVFGAVAATARPNWVRPRDAARPAVPGVAGAGDEWPTYGGAPGGIRFSRLDQVRPDNVANLEVAWTFRPGPIAPRLHPTMEVTPIMIGDTVYLCNGGNSIFALDAETGRLRWQYDPQLQTRGLGVGSCRGVAYYRAPAMAADAECAGRIVATTVDARLLAIDARSGRPCSGFGEGGSVNLKTGLGDHTPGYYSLTSAPTIARGRIVVGGSVSDNEQLGEPSGVVRAFDAITGAFAWAWDIGRPGEHGEPGPGERYTPGSPNVWAPTSADDALGLVFLPTGNATPDYWGGGRTLEFDRYSSSIVAVDAEMGEPRWSFQTTHHDLWDYDVNSQPTLADIDLGAGVVPVVIQATKRGQVFVLDRRTGRPLLEVEERSTPQGAAAGERLSPTQPFATGLPSFSGPDLRERDMWGLTPLDQLWCRVRFRQARYEGTLTPPGVRPVINYPGIRGGVGWAGVSIDPERGLMVVNANRLANYMRLIPREAADAMGVRPRRPEDPYRPERAQAGTPFAILTVPFLSPLGVPCQEPPYGTLSAVDLRTQRLIWSYPLGTARDSGPMGLESNLPVSMGVPNDGGALTTRSGLTFIGATQERAFRAVETATGRLLWQTRTPAAPHATPMTYRSLVSGRQFIVVAAGGHPTTSTNRGDYIVAYALPLDSMGN